MICLKNKCFERVFISKKPLNITQGVKEMEKIEIFNICDVEYAYERFLNEPEEESLPMLIGYGWDVLGETTLLTIEAKVYYVDSENPITYIELNRGIHHGYDVNGKPLYADTKPVEYYDFSEEGYEKASAKLFQRLQHPDQITYSKLSYDQQKIKRPELSEDDYLFLLGLSNKLGQVVDQMENDEEFDRTVKDLNIDFDIREVWQAIDDNIHDIPF